MPYLIGVVLSVGVALFARFVGFDRERSFYPTVMIVIASVYVLFAVMSGVPRVIVEEVVVMAMFVGAAVAGYRGSAWVVVAAMSGHGVFDALHGQVLDNPGVPVWWPAFCASYDLGAAAALAWLLRRGVASPRAIPSVWRLTTR